MTDSDRPADYADDNGISDSASWVLTGPDGTTRTTSDKATDVSPSEEDDDSDE